MFEKNQRVKYIGHTTKCTSCMRREGGDGDWDYRKGKIAIFQGEVSSLSDTCQVTFEGESRPCRPYLDHLVKI